MKHSTRNIFAICAVTAALLACSFPSQLITTTAPVEPPPPTSPPDVQPLHFISTPYKEEHKAPDYTITAQIPTMIEAIQPSVQKFDEYLNGIVQKEIAAFKDGMAQQPATPIMAGSSFDVTYEEIGQSGSIWTLKLNFMGFVDGAAHPYHYSITVNYDLALERDLTFDDLFLPNSNYLQVISDECAKQLKERGIGFEDEIFSKGADPLPENYKLWNLSKDGLIITFGEYQVGPYAAGPQVVTVPYSVLKDVLNPESPAAEFWK